MRVLLLFDLPMVTISDRREYTHFRKNLLLEGFIMMQESVYSKIVLNPVAATVVIQHVEEITPPVGLVQVLVITEKQFSGMRCIAGERQKEIIDDTKRLVVL